MQKQRKREVSSGKEVGKEKSAFLQRWLQVGNVGQGALLKPEPGREGRSERTTGAQERGGQKGKDGTDGMEEKEEKELKGPVRT